MEVSCKIPKISLPPATQTLLCISSLPDEAVMLPCVFAPAHDTASTHDLPAGESTKTWKKRSLRNIPMPTERSMISLRRNICQQR